MQVAKNPPDGVVHVVDNCIGRKICGRPFLFGCPISGAHENTAGSHRTGKPDIEPFVADYKRAPGIESQIARGLIHGIATGLPALAAHRISFDDAVRMVRTIIIPVDAGVLRLEQRRDVPVHGVHAGFG